MAGSALRGRVPAIGPERGAVPFEPHVQLRRRADQTQRRAFDQAVEVEEEHVGGGVEPAQRPVDAERLGRSLAREALRQHHLEDVARGDVLFRLPHRSHVLLRRQVRGQIGAAILGVGRGAGRQRAGDAAFDLLQPRLRFGAARFLVVAHLRMGDQQQPAERVVERHHRIGQEEDGIGQVGVLRQHQARLEEADGVVAQVAHQPAGETRQTRHRDGVVESQLAAQKVQRILVVGEVDLTDAVRPMPRHGAAAQHIRLARVDADERVARQVLAAGDAFQQERRTVAGELEIDGDRGFQVSGQLAHDGDQGACAGRRCASVLGRDRHGHLHGFVSGQNKNLSCPQGRERFPAVPPRLDWPCPRRGKEKPVVMTTGSGASLT